MFVAGYPYQTALLQNPLGQSIRQKFNGVAGESEMYWECMCSRWCKFWILYGGFWGHYTRLKPICWTPNSVTGLKATPEIANRRVKLAFRVYQKAGTSFVVQRRL